MSRIKIVSWNVNGIRSLKPGIKEILANLDGDIVCFQETKLMRNQLEETIAFVDGYTSYFSFPRHISGYSGVATYCRNSCRPIHAEEGLLGLLSAETFNQCPLKDDFQLSELQQLENEGRALITEHLVRYKKEEKLAVINVYCPRADPERPERKEYKLKFYQILQYRTEEYLKNNYHIIIIGDINTAHKPIDHCDPGNIQEFSEDPARKWLDAFLCKVVPLRESTEGEQSGLMVDTFRYFNPNQKDAYTCWNSRTSARMINYGTRIDYILTNRAFLSFVKESIMLSEVQGSDHCPVAVTIHCTPMPAEQTPKICTRNWPEFAGKQQTLLGFLKNDCIQTHSINNYPSAQSVNYKKQQGLKVQKPITQFLANNTKQRHTDNEDSVRKKPRIVGNENISSSFDDVAKQKCSQSDSTLVTSINDCKMESQDVNCPHSVDSDCSENPVSEQSSYSETSDFEQKQIWRRLLSGPPLPPLCKGHNEPCVLRTVKREGMNYGRQFFSCSKPVGPSSNPNSSCNHFEWVKSLRKMPQKR